MTERESMSQNEKEENRFFDIFERLLKKGKIQIVNGKIIIPDKGKVPAVAPDEKTGLITTVKGGAA